MIVLYVIGGIIGLLILIGAGMLIHDMMYFKKEENK